MVSLNDVTSIERGENYNMLFVVVGTHGQHTTYWTKAVPYVAVYVNRTSW